MPKSGRDARVRSPPSQNRPTTTAILNARDVGGQRLPAAELRTRALSHLVSVYDQVRRMLGYVRWSQGDADEIAPSLYAARRGFYRASSGSTEPTPSTPNGSNPNGTGPTPPVTPEPATPVTPIDPIPGSGPAPFTS